MLKLVTDISIFMRNRITMGKPYSIDSFSYHVFSDNTNYQLIAKRILYNIPIGEKIFLV